MAHTWMERFNRAINFDVVYVRFLDSRMSKHFSRTIGGDFFEFKNERKKTETKKKKVENQFKRTL